MKKNFDQPTNKNPTSGLSIGGKDNTAPSVDGLAQCLCRIQDRVKDLYEVSARVRIIANNMGGVEPDECKEDANPVPDNMVGIARHIENSLITLLNSQRHQVDRIEDNIGWCS